MSWKSISCKTISCKTMSWRTMSYKSMIEVCCKLGYMGYVLYLLWELSRGWIPYH